LRGRAIDGVIQLSVSNRRSGRRVRIEVKSHTHRPSAPGGKKRDRNGESS